MPLPLLLLLLATTAVAKQQEEEEEAIAKTRSGLEAAKRLTDALSPRIFDSTSPEQLVALLTGVVSLGRGAASLVGSSSDAGCETKEMRQLREQFAVARLQLQSVSLPLQDSLQLLHWTGARAVYANLEKHIADCARSFDTFVKASVLEQNFYWRQFRSQLATSKQSAYQLYQAIAEREFVASRNLAAAVVQLSKNHQPKVTAFLLWLTRAILNGAQMQIAYERMQYSEMDAAMMEKLWLQRMERLGMRLWEIDSAVRRQWEPQMLEDLREMGIHRQFCRNMAETVYNFLAEKFPWRHWMLVSFLRGDNQFSMCPGSHVFGNSLAVSSSDRRDSRFEKSAAEAALRNNGFPLTASELRARLPDCRQAAFIARIHTERNYGANAFIRYWVVTSPERRAFLAYWQWRTVRRVRVGSVTVYHRHRYDAVTFG